MVRWLLVKVLDDDLFETFYEINQQRGVDCMEVRPEQLATQDASLMAFITDGRQAT